MGEDVAFLGSYLSGSEEDAESVDCSLPGARELPWEDDIAGGLVTSESCGGSRLTVHYHYRAVGRRLRSTKLRHSWTLRPACSDDQARDPSVDNTVARVDLKHSRLSGKKQIFLDGDSVLTSWQACLSWSFDNGAHGVRVVLVSEKGRHTLRCEDLPDKVGDSSSQHAPVFSVNSGIEKRYSRESSVPLPMDGERERRTFVMLPPGSSFASSPPGVSFSSATEIEDTPLQSRGISAPELESASMRPTPASSSTAAQPVPHASRGTTASLGGAGGYAGLMPCEPSVSLSSIHAPCGACIAANVKIRRLSDENASLRQALSRRDEQLREKDEKIAALECQATVAALDRKISGGTATSLQRSMKFSGRSVGVEGLSDASDDESPTAHRKHRAERQPSQTPTAAAKRNGQDGHIDLRSDAGSDSVELLLPDRNLDLEAGSLLDLNCTNQWGSAPPRGAEDVCDLGVTNQLGPLLEQAIVEEDDCSELGVTNHLETLGVVSDNEKHASYSAFEDSQDCSDLGVTNRLGMLGTCEQKLEDKDEEDELGVTNQLGCAGVHAARSLDPHLALPTSCVASAPTEATPTARGVVTEASPMANTQCASRQWGSAPPQETIREYQVHSGEAPPLAETDGTTNVFRSLPLSGSDSALESKEEPTVPVFTGRCFLESPLS